MTTTEVEACNEFNLSLNAKENLVLVQNLVNEPFNPVTVQMPSIPDFVLDEWQGLCSPVFRLIALNPVSGQWSDWEDAQSDIIHTYMADVYPSDHGIWTNWNNWVKL